MKYLIIILMTFAIGAGRFFAPPRDLLFTPPGLYEIASHLWIGFLLSVAIGWIGWWVRSLAIIFIVLLIAFEVTMYVTNGDLSMFRVWS